MKKSFFELDRRPQLAGPIQFLVAIYAMGCMLVCIILPLIWLLGILSLGFYLGLYLSVVDDYAIRSSLGSDWHDEFQLIKNFLIWSSIFLLPWMIGTWMVREIDS